MYPIGPLFEAYLPTISPGPTLPDYGKVDIDPTFYDHVLHDY